jgi:hypothetical protein
VGIRRISIQLFVGWGVLIFILAPGWTILSNNRPLIVPYSLITSEHQTDLRLFNANSNENSADFEQTLIAEYNPILAYDQNNNRISDSLEALCFHAEQNQTAESIRVLWAIAESNKNAEQLRNFIQNQAFEKSPVTIYNGTILFAGLYEIANLTVLLTDPTVLSNIYYVKEDALAESNMLESLNQVQLNLPEFYALENQGDPMMRLAILDRGVDGTHPAFAGKDIYWKDFMWTNYSTPTDPTSHGTACAAIAVGKPYMTSDYAGRTLISSAITNNWGTGWEPNINYIYYVGAVNVSQAGQIEYRFNWNRTAGSEINITQISLLNQNGIYVNNQNVSGQNTETILTQDISTINTGIYRFAYVFNFPAAASGSEHTIQADIRIPYAIRNQTTMGSGDPFQIMNSIRGIAPAASLAVLRCAFESEIIAAMNWVLTNGKNYNITTISISLSIPSPTILRLANDLVRAGFVVFSSAGNDGPGSNYAGSLQHAPASAALAISVGAVGRDSSLTSYTAEGGYFSSENVIKPDLVAPGGERTARYDFNTPIITADANGGEFLKENVNFAAQTISIVSLPERVVNDSGFYYGTSFSTPFAAGVGLLLMNQQGGMQNWTYSLNRALQIKNLLLCTASETAPNQRIGTGGVGNPTLDRGGKDSQEGYGLLNPLAALDLISQHYTGNISITGNLYSNNESLANLATNFRFDQAKAFSYRMEPDKSYNFALTMAATQDVDLFIYSTTPTSQGEPVILKASTNSTLGADEIISRLWVNQTQDVYVVIKSALGYGEFNLTINQIPDLTPPREAIIYSPGQAAFLSENIIIAANAIDDELGVRSVHILVTKMDATGQPMGEENQTKAILPYTSLFSWDSRVLSDGWYRFIFRFVDGAGNYRDSDPLLWIIDNTSPTRGIIISPTPFAIVAHKFIITGEISDDFSGIASIFLFHHTTEEILAYQTVPNPPEFLVFGNYSNTIQASFTVTTDKSWDGHHSFSIGAMDRAGNIYLSNSVVVYVDNAGYDFRAFWTAVGVAIPLIYLVNKLAKQILSKVDFIETWEKFLQIPKILQKKINSPNTKRIRKHK